MDKGGGIECLPRLFAGQHAGRQPTQFAVDQGQQLVGRVWIASLNGIQDTRDVGHKSTWGYGMAAERVSRVRPRDWKTRTAGLTFP